MDIWNNLETSEFIDLKTTLFSGQIFNFIETDKNEFTGTLYFFIVVFKQTEKSIKYKILKTKIDNQILIKNCINKFFTLHLNYLENFYGLKPYGLRLVTNNLIQTIFSFICSSNNNIKRISKMIHFLYSKGEFACKFKNFNFFYFPNCEILSKINNELVENKFGYRSKFISKTAHLLFHDEKYADILNYDYLNSNLNVKYKIHDLLLNLPGVGPKVRDCICLMSLGLYEIVPIDTHILKYSRNLFNLSSTKFTLKIYKNIQRLFIEKYGKYAGIYQLFIFKNSLK